MESAGLLFKIKGDSSDAVRAFKDTEQAMDGVNPSVVSLTSSFNFMSIAALGVASVLATVAAASIAATRAVHDLAKSTAEYGSAIFDASEKTGLSAERLSAMKFAADQSGSSLEQVTGAAARFAKTMGDAANGSKEAEARLARLGVTSADTDTAFKQALQTIVNTEKGWKQTALAMDAFGKSGAELLPFIKSFDGDLDALTAQAKKLGVTITDEAAVAADKFGDQLDTLNAQLDGVARTVGTVFMPMFQNMAASLSNFLTQNQDNFQKWSQNVSYFIRGVGAAMQYLDNISVSVTNSSIAAWGKWALDMYKYFDPLANLIYHVVNGLKQLGREAAAVGSKTDPNNARDELEWGRGRNRGGGMPAPSGGGGSAGGAGRASTVDNSARDAEQLAARDLAAQTKIEAVNLKTVLDQMALAYKAMRTSLGGDDSIAEFTEQTNQATQKWAGNLLDALRVVEELEKQALKADATANEKALLQQQQDERRHKLKLAQDEEIKKNSDAAWELRLKRAETERAIDEADYQREKDRQEQFEKDAGFGNIPGLAPAPIINPDVEAPGPFDKWTESWTEFFTLTTEQVPTLNSLFGDFGEMLQRAFLGVAQAIGSVVQQWVLYGKTGPAVMRQILAAALASIAAEAAVKAIMATAEGFFLLATGNPGAAAWAFAAAGFYAAVAGATALAGRAIAGDSFNKESKQATGGSTQGNRGGSGDQGSAYSSQEDQVIEQGRNAPGGATVTFGLKDGASAILANLMEIEIKNNGPFRTMIKGVAEG